MVNESGGGAASEVEGFYNLSFNEPYNNFTIMNIDADKSAKVMFGSEMRVLNPGDEWRRKSESQVRQFGECALINETFVTVINNFGLWDKSTIKRRKTKILGKKMALPSMKIKSFEGLFEIFSGAKDIFIDCTERQIQRPKDKY
ncbi:hypothetical protein C5S29_01165 [ANME-1 cluster archaeon GoMg3.2]|nr:hypothetical protein [ANME-1 cluster archaeon GoMg3.2]